MEAQGYRAIFLNQDNKNTIITEKNGKSSSSKRTKYTNIFFHHWKYQ